MATDTEGKIVRMNHVAERLTGWKFEEAVGQPLPEVFKIVNGNTRKEVENPVDKVLREGKVVGLANHTVLISRDGTEYQIADSGAPIMEEGGSVKGVVLVFRDVTEEYRLQQWQTTRYCWLIQRRALSLKQIKRRRSFSA
jgi:PAS domain S-box-containing protein